MKDHNTNQSQKAVVYASQAAEDAQAMAEQIEAAHRIAADLGYTDCETISEYGSGMKIRPEFRELLERVEAGEVRTIVTVRLDRITRDPVRLEEAMGRMAAAGCSLVVE